MVEHLTHKHEDGSLILRIHMKRQSVVDYTCNPVLEKKKQREADAQPSWPANLPEGLRPVRHTICSIRKRNEEKGQGFESRRLVHGRAGEEREGKIE